MRVRILQPPPAAYSAETQSLLLGRVYNLDASLASALVLDGCAEVYDTLTPEEKRERTRTDVLWEAPDGKRFLPKP
jgi:hypothetical protein